jgi:hypothetical protein|tara:strand:- start:3487 stop:3654 length:168 start_codon:yes stop_codon:yes gene_type:complete
MNKKQRKARIKAIKTQAKFQKRTGYANIREEAYANNREWQAINHDRYLDINSTYR